MLSWLLALVIVVRRPAVAFLLKLVAVAFSKSDVRCLLFRSFAMAFLKCLMSFLLVVELTAVRPAHDMKHLEKESSEGKPCCGCKLSGGFLGLGRKCVEGGTITNADYASCTPPNHPNPERETTCDRRYEAYGDYYACWTKKKGERCTVPDTLP